MRVTCTGGGFDVEGEVIGCEDSTRLLGNALLILLSLLGVMMEHYSRYTAGWWRFSAVETRRIMVM
jgi:hypothetical protein